jgi:hypothetical protein
VAEIDTPPDEERWAADVLYGTEPSAAPAAPSLADADEIAAAPVDLDTDDIPSAPNDSRDVNAGAKKAAFVLVAGVVVAVSAIVAALVTFGDDGKPPPSRTLTPSAAAAAEPVPSPTAAPPQQDQAVPFTAAADCPAGSTSAQALTDTAGDSAWVCVRGPRGAAVDGQVLNITFGDDPQAPRTFMLSAVEVTPGWVAKTPGGKDEWLAHRVVTRLQYLFYNGNQVQIFTQDTGNIHGPVSAPLPKELLASRVKVIVLKTSRPPSSPLPSAAPDAGGDQPGFVESALGEAGAALAPQTTHTPDPTSEDPGSDPVDYTFAMSSLKFVGHPPN